MNQRIVLIGVMMGLVAAGCDGSRLRRTATNRWETRTFKEGGVTLTIPSASKVRHHPSFGVSVWLHPLSAAGFRLQDTQYFVVIGAERKARRLFEEERASLMEAVQRTQENAFQFWSAAEHPVVDARPGNPYSYYRYDVKCRGGDLVRLTAEVRHPVVDGTPKFQSADDAVVRRILNSAECIGR